MIPLILVMKGDGCWPDIDPATIIQPEKPLQIAVLDAGMTSGLPSVSIRVDLPDGRIVIAETSARLFVTAGRAIGAKYPDLFEEA